MGKTNIALFVFCLFGIGTAIQAQTTIPSTGGNATGTGGTVSYTIGQIVYTTNSGSTGSVAQGVQQPYEISVVTSIEHPEDIMLMYSVYPNPTVYNLTLKIENFDKGNLSYWLYGVSGNLIETRKVFSNETRISMGNQVSGTYFLKVTSGKTELITFKIIKN